MSFPRNNGLEMLHDSQSFRNTPGDLWFNGDSDLRPTPSDGATQKKRIVISYRKKKTKGKNGDLCGIQDGFTTQGHSVVLQWWSIK